MSLPPGLLPETNEPSPSRTSWGLGAGLLVALLALGGLLAQNRRLASEHADAVADLARLRRQLAAAPATPPPAAVPAPDPAPGRAAPESPAPSVAPVRAPELRVLKDRAEDPQFITRGLHEFRSGRYDQAERQFFRAFPDSILYLALTGLAQRNWREAFAFLSRSMTLDPKWLGRVHPRDLFGSEADYDALVQSLEDQISKNPLDADLKVLSAYLRFHDKGAPYAKALLIEATNVNPDHEAAKAFLEALGP
jgi:tetratricopeptide (TPR) repeat protein